LNGQKFIKEVKTKLIIGQNYMILLKTNIFARKNITKNIHYLGGFEYHFSNKYKIVLISNTFLSIVSF